MTSGFRRGVRGLRREVREVVVRSIWVEGGWRRRNDGGHGDGMTGHGGDGRARKQQQRERESEREGQSE